MNIYRLEEVVSIPGGGSKKTLKSFFEKDEAKQWLIDNGYEEIKHMRSWEKASEQDFMVDVFVKIRTEKVG